MGEALYEQLAKDHPDIAYRTYAPVGSHRDLLAYLVRRLLENGANSSFVAQASDYRVPVTALLQRPADAIVRPQHAAHPKIPLPGDLFAPERRNSRGVEFGARAALDRLLTEVKAETIDLKPIADATPDQANAAVAAARAGFAAWSRTPAATRARRRWSRPRIFWRTARPIS
ncbi:delta 1-pyrroline-5-carboxylate dehydrogenase [Bradyrhizobium sp. GM7.3]